MSGPRRAALRKLGGLPDTTDSRGALRFEVHSGPTSSAPGRALQTIISPSGTHLQSVPHRTWRQAIDELGSAIDLDGHDLKTLVVRSMFDAAILDADVGAATWLARFGGGTTELSDLTDEQLRALLGARLGLNSISKE